MDEDGPVWKKTFRCREEDESSDFINGKNFAPEGKTSQCSVYHRLGVSHHGNDGNREGVYKLGSCILTRSEPSPWWRLDFNAPRTVGAVVIVNRQDCCWQRLIGAEVRVGDSPDNNNPVCGIVTEAEAGLVTTFCCDGMVGRYVSVVIPGREDILNLCEVEVYPEGKIKHCA
ncbi:fucolectin-1-like [Bombina bombina]|uniref:fucolectin-1-like n=1 Tax=Bombina bombina TaxID=8345 RepID=UPI00235A7BFE|nr:fucolectin-1-like [Bombina bombina]